MRLGLALGLIAALAAGIGLAARAVTPPAARAADAPAGEFSAERAAEVLQALLGEGQPHPVGSTEHALLRERLIARLAALGLTPELQRRYSCGQRVARCAPVVNVIARIPGSSPLAPVMLAAHYDSVAVAPGAGDDGAGLAVLLEIARALLAQPPLRRSVLLAFTDAEEVGLLGAEAFVQQPDLREQVFAVINYDNRGTSGPSLMFETSDDNARLMALYARAVPRPLTSSLYFEVYRRMPRDTDFSVFKRAGLPGYNFAFIGDASWYHTPLDDIAHLDLRSVQQHGDNGLALARTLAAAEGIAARGNASYVDVAGLGLVRWPQAWNRALAGVSVLLLLAAGVIAVRQGHARARDVPIGLGAWLFTVVVAIAAAAGLDRTIDWLAAPTGDWSVPAWPLRVTVWTAVAAAAAAGAALLGSLGRIGIIVGVWLGWTVIGLGLALWLPGASVVVLLPALAAAAAALAGRLIQRGSITISLLVVAFAGAIGFTGALLIEQALGLSGAPLLAVFLLLPATASLPLLATLRVGWRAAALCAAIALLGTVWASATADRDPRRPPAFNLYHVQDLDRGEAHWVAGPLGGGRAPPAFADAVGLSPAAGPAVPWLAPRGAIFRASATLRDVRRARLDLRMERRDAQAGMRSLELHLVPGAATDLSVLVPESAGEIELRVEGQKVEQERSAGLGSYRSFGLLQVPGDGLALQLLLPDSPVELLIVESAPGLPAAGATLLEARDAAAVQTGGGDRSLAYWRSSH